jgi:adenylate cyclase
MTDSRLRDHLVRLGAAESALAGLGDNDLIGMAGDLQITEGLDLNLEELAARCGVSVDRVGALYSSFGLDAELLAGFGEGDIKMLSLALADDTGLVDQVGTELFRVAGRSLRRIAEAAVAIYVQDVENHPDQLKMDLIELADLNAGASQLAVAFGDTLGTIFRHHMWAAVRGQRTGQHGDGPPELIQAGIGFVDLVGFTPLSRSLSPGELMELVGEFEQRAFEVAGQNGGQIVKSIGDEVMIAGPDHGTVIAIVVALVSSFADDPEIRPCAGVTAGQVVFRLGDYYGPLVNLASRLVDIAEPGEVLTDRGVSDSDLISLRPAGQRSLKGFDQPVDVWLAEY